jgi:hypothetical protein
MNGEMTMNTETTTFNRSAIAATVLAAVAVLGMFLSGIGGLAVFAVGAGHVAINQINAKGGRGKELAITALALGYGIGLWSSFAAIQIFLSGAAQQL